MNSIVAILRAAHCKSVHHFFAIDAFCEVFTDDGQQLVRMLLANFNQYLKGAKDPDTSFKDFENHVVHVADGYWGGAAKTAKKWLDNSYRLLQQQKWSEAAYAIGVLSHYFTDPIMPLHTAQSAKETAIHRPLEWSVCCAYEEIYAIACSSENLSSFELPRGDQWLGDAIHLGARLAHQYYDTLLDDYDMAESRRFPAKALSPRSKRILAQLFTWAITGWADTLERIAADANQEIPTMSLTVPTIMATSQVPAKRIAQKIESTQQQAEVEKILEEYLQTGNVVRNVPIEQKIVRKVRIEQPALKPSAKEIQRAEQIVAPKSVKQATAPASKPAPEQTIEAKIPEESIPQQPAPPRNEPTPPPLATRPIKSLAEPTPKASQDKPRSEESTPKRKPERTERESIPSQPRQSLQLDSPIVDAPAIGPKTAARFIEIGIETVRDLLSHDCEELSASLETKWITPKLVKQWQAQAQLAIDIERLSAAGAGLLVLAGIESADQVATLSARELHRMIVAACESNEGKRLLRDKPPPPLATVERWIQSAAQVSK